MRIEGSNLQLRLSGIYSPQLGGRATPPVPARQEVQATDPAVGRAAQVMRIVAGVVPGGIDFSGETPQPSAGTLPLYRHPAERNAAATGVELGRTIDLNG
ncbi:MAG: hypothetical protein ACF8NJ_05175 [Phycisphaerales bacterium JB038]